MSKDPNGHNHTRATRIASLTSPFAQAVHNISRLQEAVHAFTAAFGANSVTVIFSEAGITATGKQLKAIKRGQTPLPAETLEALSRAATTYAQKHL
ncbi:MAG: hypothetical protein KDJ15_01090 [Alphaproteobacteria bacterium]|nr:hypothetical protein [Alphaproteobacteria bacterium]